MLTAKKSPLPLFLLTLVVVLALPSTVFAQTSPFDPVQDEALEEEAQDIDRMIMCPVCPAETIDQAQVEISFQMRAVIREMLAEGRSREEILDYFVDRYGADILAAPPKSGVNLLAWILPIIGVGAGLGALFLVIRAMTARSPAGNPVNASVPGDASGSSLSEPPTAFSEQEGELAPYLDIVDRRLAARRGAHLASGNVLDLGNYPQGESGVNSETELNG